jgi:hypothetical protein
MAYCILVWPASLPQFTLDAYQLTSCTLLATFLLWFLAVPSSFTIVICLWARECGCFNSGT